MKWSAVVLIVGLSTSQASADFFTGASFVKDDSNFAIGFAWGVVQTWLAFPGIETAENIEKIGQCLSDGNITSGVMAEAVKGTIRNDPSLLSKVASQAVLNTLYAICPVR